MPFLQETIYKLEVGGGRRRLQIALLVLGVVAFTVLYNLRAYRNLGTLEAMDAAQVARNLAEGKGYTTLFLRPLSLHLVRSVNERRAGVPPLGALPDHARIKQMHPDLANPPLYPLLLAGWMKLLPFRHPVDLTGPFWSVPPARLPEATPGGAAWTGQFYRYQPDFLIAVFNQLLFFVLVGIMYLLARRLFDPAVAGISALILLGTDLYWRFNVSGLSTTLLLVVFAGLLWVLVLLEGELRAPRWGRFGVAALAAAGGALVGVGCLTRYAFGWLLLPWLVFLAWVGGPRRGRICLLALGAFLVVVAPWVARNYQVSGTPFGTAGYALLENTGAFTGYRLQRSLQPEFRDLSLWLLARQCWYKLIQNARPLLQQDLLRLGGGWIAAFFFAGLLVGFRNPTVRWLRYFLLLCVPVLVAVQALGRTQLSDDAPEINSENLLVLLGPLVIVLGVSFFFVLLDQINLPFAGLRPVIIGVFVVLMCLPMVFTFLPPRTTPLVYPPYDPPKIQQAASWLKENELMMSDVPWAVAWYGKRQCVWMTLHAIPTGPNPAATQETFFAINDYQKPIHALYLSPRVMDARLLSELLRAGEQTWGSLIITSLLRQEIPASFPLRAAPDTYAADTRFLPDQLFLADWERWRRSP